MCDRTLHFKPLTEEQRQEVLSLWNEYKKAFAGKKTEYGYWDENGIFWCRHKYTNQTTKPGSRYSTEL